MSLVPIVRACGGDLYAGGRRANIPAPGHSRHDRSISLMWLDGRVIVHSFGGADWREAVRQLRDLGLLDAENRLLAGGPASRCAPPVLLTQHERERAARALWAGGQHIAGTLSEVYLRSRHIRRDLPAADALRHHGSVPLAVYGKGRSTSPALLAAVRDRDGRVTAVEIVYLDGRGRRSRWPRVSRKTVGRIAPGSAVRLDAGASRLLVAEGVATALSASERFGAPAWALLSTGNLRAWSPPLFVSRLMIAADRGRDGEVSARVLARRMAQAGVRVAVRFPPPPFGDWNDAAAERPEGKGGGEGEGGRALAGMGLAGRGKPPQ